MGSASYLFTFVFIFRNLLWGSVNNGQPLHGLHNTKRLRTTGLSNHEIHQPASLLIREYLDFEVIFPLEIIHFAGFFRAAAVARRESMLDKHCVTNNIEVKMFLLLKEKQCADTFLNVHLALHIYSLMMASNCTKENGFLCLQRIKNKLRNTMAHKELQLFALCPSNMTFCVH